MNTWSASLLPNLDKGVLKIGVCLSIATYLILVRTLRYSHRRKLEKVYAHLLLPDGTIKPGAELNPVDAQKIIWFLCRYEHPFAFRKSLEFALFKTYGVPEIASLLCETGELSRRDSGGKRAEDTSVLFQEFINNPLDSERCRLAVARTNYLHGRYGKKVSHENIMFTWAACVVETVDWFQKYEWSTATPLEKHALLVFWREIGRRMGVPRSIEPSTYEELEKWYRDYDATHSVYSEQSHTLAETTIDIMMRSIAYKSLHPSVRKVIIFSMGDRLRLAMGMEEPSATVGKIVQTAFDIRSWIIRNLSLPRFQATYYPGLAKKPNAQGKYVKGTYTFEPYYNPRTIWKVLEGWFITGLVPSQEKYLSDGYEIEKLGPKSLEEKGLDTVRENATNMESGNRGTVHGCPFAF